MSPTSSPASWGALQSSDKSARPEHIEKCQQRCRSSVTTSLVYRRARPSRWAYVENFLSNSPFFVNFARIFVILCIFRALIKLFGKQVMGEAAYFGFDSVLHTPPPTSHTKKNHPTPFSLSPCEPRLFWQNQLAELIFKKKRPRQNWSRGHFEATQRAKFSILKPNFWSGDAAMGMAHWHNPNRVNFFSNIR